VSQSQLESNLQSKITSLDGKNDTYLKEISDNKTSIASLEAEIERFQSELETSKNNHSTAAKNLAQAQAQISHLEGEVRDREKILDETE
jgi:peptidoglycan hydrolase CwlO-like protein